MADREISTDHVPVPVAVVVPTAPSILLERVMVTLGSDVHDIVSPEVLLVMLSEFDIPVSYEAARSNPAGVLIDISIVMLRAEEFPEVLPAVYVATAVIA